MLNTRRKPGPGASTVEVIPSARRLVTSLRDLGYDFVHAVADLVDNSIAAGATEINIDVRFDGPDSRLRIADNGDGMSGSEITEAMRYGSQRSYRDDDLGKFGLGLKTASMSQCRRLSVASRTDPSRNRLEARRLDLDHIERTDQWEVLVLGPEERTEELVAPLERHTGTVVMWQALDRVLGYKLPWGERARSGLLTLVEQLDSHLGMVFHRFLAGEVKQRKKLRIVINGRVIESWDPFAREEKATEVLPGQEFDVQTTSGVGIVRFQPYVLPPERKFSSENAFKRLSGPARWNAQQGFYIYRANRMIQSGGWCRMRTLDEHAKLARASIDFFPDLDSAFEVNVAKFRVSLPASLRERLLPSMENWIRRAQAAYRQSDERGSGSGSSRGGSAQWRPVKGTGGGGTDAGTRGPDLIDVRPAIEAAAVKAGQTDALARIVKALRATAPEVARLLGW